MEEANEFDPSSQLDPKFGINGDDDGDDHTPSSKKPGVADTPAFAQQPPRRVMFTSGMKDDLRALFQMTQDDSPPQTKGLCLCVLFALHTALGTLPETVLVLRCIFPTEKSITATAFRIGVFPTSIRQIIESFGTWLRVWRRLPLLAC